MSQNRRTLQIYDDARAPLLDDGTNVIAVLLMGFKKEFNFPTPCHCGWK